MSAYELELLNGLYRHTYVEKYIAHAQAWIQIKTGGGQSRVTRPVLLCAAVGIFNAPSKGKTTKEVEEKEKSREAAKPCKNASKQRSKKSREAEKYKKQRSRNKAEKHNGQTKKKQDSKEGTEKAKKSKEAEKHKKTKQ
jgi:Mg-chelatase subunit ChlI